MIFLPTMAWSQLSQYPLERKKTTQKKVAAKIQAPQPQAVSLPFWDDFSFTTETHAVDSLWLNNNQVFINNGQARFAPSINVATFDGLDENGVPYSPSPPDQLEFGYRDTLESQPIKMTEVPVLQRNSVFFSFFYQAGGYGEPPDPNDFLLLQFKSLLTGWEDIATLRVYTGMDPTFFYDTIIQINQGEYYHDEFQFRFISFGRKSGRYDAWHIDYVYLDKGRSINDTYFPDRSSFTPLSPLFNSYYAAPFTHLKTDLTNNMGLVSFGLGNLENDLQPMNFSLYEKTTSYAGGVPSVRNVTLLDESPVSPTIQALEKRMITAPQSPDLSTLLTADSLRIDLTLVLETGDSINVGFEPINFETNDTLRKSYTLKDFYAYDDNLADYAAGLTTAGNYLAYRFDMITNLQDTINGVEIHFPYFAGSVTTAAQFFILDHENGKPGRMLYEQTIDVNPTSNNYFQKIDFFEGTIVLDTFYLGYREPATTRVRVGLDKSNDTGDRMYFKLTNTSPWQVNDRVTGSLMIRPKFGYAPIITGVTEEESNPVSVYPNPGNGEFYLTGPVQQCHVFTITGQTIPFSIEDFEGKKKLTVQAQPGMYLLRYRAGQKIYTDKVIITP